MKAIYSISLLLFVLSFNFLKAQTLTASFTTSSNAICLGESITFTDSSTGGPVSWTWNFVNGTPTTANTQGSHTVIFNTAGVHDITLNVGDGITTDDTTIQVIVNTPGFFTPLTNTKKCSSFSLILDVDAQNMTNLEWFVNDGSGFVSLLGNANYIGADTDALTIALGTTLNGNIYRVVMLDACANLNTSEMTLEVYIPQPIPNPHPDISFCNHQTRPLTVNYNGYNFEWNTGDFGSTVVPKESGTYTVSFIDNATECRLTDNIEVEITDCIADCNLDIASAFSPNGDGVNDKLKVLSNCKDGFNEFEFILTNRWGTIIYTSKNPNFEWDGNYKNQNIEIGVYAYSLKFVKNFSSEISSKKGNITVIR